ncbi:MAG: proline-rich domain-containing protein [Candidatus Zixiibacteriota bacterium]
MRLELRILFLTIAVLISPIVSSLAQPSIEPLVGKDAERIWFDFDARGRLDPDPYASDYRGGNVSFRVSGLLEPTEYDDSSMIGYGSWELPFTLSIEPCKVIDPTDGSVTTESSCRRNAQGKIIINLRFNLETGLGELALNSSGLMSCVAGKPPDRYNPEIMYYIGSIEDREIHPNPPLMLTRADLEAEFEKNWSWDMESMGMARFTNCPLLWNINMTLSSKPPEKAKVSIAGCANIMIGVSANLTATVEPETEGTYTWFSEPSDVFDISGSGSSATAAGKNAGHATIRVEFQPKKGKKVEGKLSGSVVELLSVNGGADIPVIGIYDENGVEKPPVQVPIQQDPPEGDLLSFPVADAAIASVQNLGTSLAIQGVKEGVTSARGQTGCGDQDEHLITIQVVPCDKETIQKLRDRLKELKAQWDELRAENDRLLKSPEFTRAKHEFDKNLTKCWVKVFSILASGLGAVEGAVSGAAPGVTDLDNIADMLGDFYDATEEGTWEGNWSLWNMYKNYQIGAAKKMTLGIANDVIEYGEAWFAVEDALQVIKEVVKTLQENRMRYKEVRNQHDEIDRRLVELCNDFGDGSEEPGGSEPGQPQQPPTEPKGGEPSKPSGGAPPPTEPGSDQPPTDQPSGDGDQPQSPTDDDSGGGDERYLLGSPFPAWFATKLRRIPDRL